MVFAGILREKNKYRRRFLSKTENLWVRENFSVDKKLKNQVLKDN
jgi:hypothetical protein